MTERATRPRMRTVGAALAALSFVGVAALAGCSGEGSGDGVSQNASTTSSPSASPSPSRASGWNPKPGSVAAVGDSITRGFDACPRDSMLVIGDEIIETPMAWPCRYFETHSYRRILKDYFRRGARWTAAPKPQLTDELFEKDFRTPGADEPMRYILTEFEPVFDAADFVRAGRDLFVTRSNVTNGMGIEWLRRHLGPGYRIHEIESRCRTPMHIDTTFLVLAPGKALVNPDYIDVDRLPAVLDSWDILVAPEPEPVKDLVLRTTSMCGKWLSMNILMVDETRVIAERHHTGMLRALERWGFEPIPCDLMHYAPFGGSFHCATLDVRRRGTLESYFD
ncbi:hypothetical protein SCYAM73S_00507 [Streptomyces cyaneofuscatus]